MEMEANHKYKIMDVPVKGTIVQIEEPIPYRTGNGFFRNVLLRTGEAYDPPAFFQLTLFGEDALNLDPERDLERSLQCTGRLNSRSYIDRNGNMRWSMSISADGVILGPRKMERPASAEETEGAKSAVDDTEDIPF